MLNADSMRTRIAPKIAPTRNRLHAMGALAALGLLAGLSGPAAAASATTGPFEPIGALHADSADGGALGGTTITAAKPQPGQPQPGQPKAGKAAAKPLAAPAPKPAAAKPAANKATAKKAANPGGKPAAATPSTGQLHPNGIVAAQETFTPTNEQLRNARTIIETGKKLGLPPRAWVIALSTAMQESTLRNLGNLGANNDHDSLGLFQQRPSSGWGTPEEILNPTYAATQFYEGLQGVSGWQDLPVTVAAQQVQVSAFPDHYAKWEKQAGDLVRAFYGQGPYAAQAAALK